MALEALALTRAHVHLATMLGQVDIVAAELGIQDEIREAVQLAPEGPWKDVALYGAAGEFQRCADLFAEWGARSLEAEARLFGGEQLIAAGRRREGEAQIERALEFYRSVGAASFVQRGDALLAQSAYSDSA